MGGGGQGVSRPHPKEKKLLRGEGLEFAAYTPKKKKKQNNAEHIPTPLRREWEGIRYWTEWESHSSKEMIDKVRYEF